MREIRGTYIPRAGFPAGDHVYLTGAPAFGLDFVNKAYGAFPWLLLAVLVITYFVLLRAFRSVVLPIKAVLMNLLSITASYGALVLVFQHGWGEVVGFHSSPQIEAWIPIFLFAMLFGLSMDYEIFLLTRMREEWDRFHDNERAVAYGLERTGRIITAAALIMIAAFSGLMSGTFVGLQEFGFGLAIAIFLDATIVRALLVPALMKLLGRWNWYLPERMRRTMRLGADVEPVSGARAGSERARGLERRLGQALEQRRGPGEGEGAARHRADLDHGLAQVAADPRGRHEAVDVALVAAHHRRGSGGPQACA